jgi:hypothetical protein
MPVVGGYEGMMQSQAHDMGQVLSALGGASKLQDMELHGDRARLLRAQAGLAENELSQEEAFARGMQQLGQPGLPPDATPGTAGKPGSRAAPLFKMADIALRAGAVKKGQDLLSKASTIEHQENQDIMEQQKLAYYKRKDAQDDLERLAGFYGNVKSQADLDAANAAYAQVYPNRPLPAWAGTPYSPFLIKGFKDSLLTEQQRLAAINKDEDQLARERDQEDRRTREERLRKASEAADERRRTQEIARAKAGGGKVTTNLGKDYPILAAREISDALFDGNVPPEFKKEVEGAKYVIGARAMQIRADMPALSMDQAVARAVQESREYNEWTAIEQERPTTTMGFRTGTEKVPGFKFKSRATPGGVAKQNWGDGLPPEKIKQLANLWSAVKPVPADKKFSDGTVYETPRGRLMRSGGKWYTQEEWAGR